MYKIEKGKTKIIATLGPASESEDIIRSLIVRGVDVARLNTKHNEPSWHLGMIKKVRKISAEMNTNVGIFLDLQGPEIRVENYNSETVEITEGTDYFLVAGKPVAQNEFGIPFADVIVSLQGGQEVSINDGAVEFSVTANLGNKAKLTALNSYSLGHRKTLNIPGLVADIPSLTERDLEYLEIIKEEHVDFVGLSFVRSAKDILILKEKLQQMGSAAQIIAKIETKLALTNINEIIKETDALMVARGDLGIENPIEQIAFWQKKLINLCREAGKPVIVATQMLKSMTDSPNPTRAEATDIANAVLDGTDAIMLSEETAAGKYPEKAVSAMTSISHFNEQHIHLVDNFSPHIKNVTEVFAKAASDIIEMGSDIGLDKILVFTNSGYTARAVSSFRPRKWIIAVTDKTQTANQASLIFGVRPFLTTLPDGDVKLDDIPFDKLKESKLLEAGDNVLVIHGSKWKTTGTSNLLAFIKVP